MRDAMRIIVAEHDEMVCESICDWLHDSGFEIAAATSYDAAHMLLQTATWDVLLTDFLFAERRTGLDLARTARAHGIRTVVMSGAVGRRDEVEADGLLFLAKPFRFAQLLIALAPAQAFASSANSSLGAVFPWRDAPPTSGSMPAEERQSDASIGSDTPAPQ